MTRWQPQKVAEMAVWYRANGHLDRADQLERRLVALQRCKRCGRTLTDPTSIERGIGPDCWQKEPPAYQPRVDWIGHADQPQDEPW